MDSPVLITVSDRLEINGREFFVSIMPSALPGAKHAVVLAEINENGKAKPVAWARVFREEGKVRIGSLHISRQFRGKTGTRLILSMGRVLGLNVPDIETVYYEKPPQRLSALLSRLKLERKKGTLTGAKYYWRVAKTLFGKAPNPVRREVPAKRLFRPKRAPNH